MKELHLENISKAYKQTKALSDVSFTLGNGLHALLGPNGSGKTTMMRILTQNLPADSGVVRFDGEDVRAMGKRYREKLGYMPQSAGLFPSFPLEEFLCYIGSLKGLNKKATLEQSEVLLREVELWEHRREKIGTFSGGMKQRAALVQALLGEPELLILDEPTAGLDPVQRIRVRNLIARYAVEHCVLLATHIVSDVEGIATNLLFLKKGNLIAQGTTATVGEPLQGKIWELPLADGADEEALRQRYTVIRLLRREDRPFLRVFAEEQPAESCVSVTPDLEDCYFCLFEEREAGGMPT